MTPICHDPERFRQHRREYMRKWRIKQGQEAAQRQRDQDICWLRQMDLLHGYRAWRARRKVRGWERHQPLTIWSTLNPKPIYESSKIDY